MAQSDKPVIWTVSISRLFTLFRDISPEFSARASISAINLGFDAAVEAIRERLKTERCDAIVSAGSNGAYLKQHLPVPVIVAAPGGFDIMQALARARQLSQRIGLIYYRNTFPALDSLAQSFGMQIEQRSYVTAEDARAACLALKADGISVVVGAGLITDIAAECGMTCIFIYSNDAVRRAFTDAIELTRIRDQPQNMPLPVAGSLNVRHTLNDILGTSPVMEQVRETITLFGRSKATVMIQGESGTGKEMAAQAIHHEYTLFHKHRRMKRTAPFVAVNCGAIPESLLEAELFGYEEGAFTGSRRGGRAGLFEAADGGTLFLDEIGEMPVSLQTRLLRVLEDRAIVRIGGYKPITVDVRVICATHNDLDNRVAAGSFRADLFYRLGVLRLQLPALRDRGADILLLTEKLLKLAFAELDLPLHRSHLQQILACSDFFYHYRWPGNARELRNLMERVALYCSAYPDKIITESLLLTLSPERRTVIVPASVADLLPEPVNTATATEAVARFRGDRRAAADWLGISRTTLWRRLKQEQNTSS